MKVALITDTAEGSLGVDRYARELTSRLLKSDLITKIVIVHSDNVTRKVVPTPEESASQKMGELILPLPHTRFGKGLRQLFIAPILLNRLPREGVGIVHDLYNFAPFLLSFGAYKKVVTVHDIRPLLTRWMHPWSQRTSLYIRYRCLLPLILKRAEVIIAVSNNTKRDLVKWLGVDPDKVKVVYHGISQDYQPVQDPERLDKLKHHYGITYPFILGQMMLGSIENIWTLVEAFRQLRTNASYTSRMVKEAKLVFFGDTDQGIVSEVRKMGLENEIVFLGWIPESDLSTLYSAAELFVYPSLYEGFGFPPLEAMACGTATIVSSVSSLPEVVGNGGLKFEPLDAAGLASQMYNVLTSEDTRRGLAKKGVERARTFTWEKTAADTLKIYLELLEK